MKIRASLEKNVLLATSRPSRSNNRVRCAPWSKSKVCTNRKAPNDPGSPSPCASTYMPASNPCALVHTFIYDGEAKHDFIKGLGLSFAVPLREEYHNRHISFAGEDGGTWHEPVRPLTGRRSFSSDEYSDMFAAQLTGKKLPGLQQMHRRQRQLAEDLPIWNEFKLVQNAPDYFSVE